MPDNNLTDDFNPSKLTIKVDKHHQDIVGVKKRLNKIEDEFGNHEKIADTLCNTAKKATKMGEMITMLFLQSLENNPKIQNAVNDLIKKSDRNFLYATLKRFGLFIWSLIMLTLGIIITKLLG